MPVGVGAGVGVGVAVGVGVGDGVGVGEGDEPGEGVGVGDVECTGNALAPVEDAPSASPPQFCPEGTSRKPQKSHRDSRFPSRSAPQIKSRPVQRIARKCLRLRRKIVVPAGNFVIRVNTGEAPSGTL